MRRQRTFLSMLLFVALFYVVPLQAVLRARWKPSTLAVPNPGLPLLPDPLILELNLRYVLALAAGYVVVWSLVSVALRLLRIYEWEEALAWLATVNSVKDLRGLDRWLGRILPLAAVFFASASPFWHCEGLAVLAFVVWAGVSANEWAQPGPVVPLPRPQPAQPLPEADAPDGEVRKRYAWHFPERASGRRQLPACDFSVEVLLSSARYTDCRQRPRELDVREWHLYVTEAAPELEVLAGRVLALGREKGFRSYDQATNVLAFTQQCIKYAADVDQSGAAVEYPKYPLESLMEEKGDCEDHAILMAALLKRMGFDVAILICPGHAAVGVAGANGLPGSYVTDPATHVRYFYGETTSDGWLLGELPKDLEAYMAKGEFQIIPVVMKIAA